MMHWCFRMRCLAAMVVFLLAGCASTLPSSPPVAGIEPTGATDKSAGRPTSANAESALPVASPPASNLRNSTPRTDAADPAKAASSPAAPHPTGAAAAPASGATVEPLLHHEPGVEPTSAGVGVPSVSERDLWDRIRRGFSLPDLDGKLVRRQESWYVSRPDYVQRMTERARRYLYYVVEEVERRNMPTELALLPFIESAFNPEAVSHARAAGMWQFIPSTGKLYDLRQNAFRDDRRDVQASTKAALDYLTKLHGMFDDWHLALAAYNWGEGNVQRAIAKNRRKGKRLGYEHLRMPVETRYYVPKLQAVKNLIARPEAYGIELPPIEDRPYFLSVPIDRDIDVALVAELADLEIDEFRALNPSHDKPVILAAGTPQVLLPYDNATAFMGNLSQRDGPLATWTAWIVPSTMSPADAAKRVDMSEEELREINRIPSGMLVKAGSALLVPRDELKHGDVAEHIAENAQMSLALDGPASKRVVVRARRHDTVASLARRFRLSPAHVAYWNQLVTLSALRPGQRMIVYLPVKSKIIASNMRAKKAVSSRVAAKPAAKSKQSARIANR